MTMTEPYLRARYSVILCKGRSSAMAILDAWLGNAWKRPVGVC